MHRYETGFESSVIKVYNFVLLKTLPTYSQMELVFGSQSRSGVSWYLGGSKAISISEQPSDTRAYFGEDNVNGLFIVIEGGCAENDPAGSDDAGYCEDPEEEAVQDHGHV
ncbi:hypothetical protein AVEN_136069-1, partial [Araneus ventricosus]